MSGGRTDGTCWSPRQYDSTSIVGDGLLIRVAREGHTMLENIQLLRKSIGEESESRDTTIPNVFSLSLRARCFVRSSRLACILTSLHVLVFAFVSRAILAWPLMTSLLERTSAGCRLLTRGAMCQAHRDNDGTFSQHVAGGESPMTSSQEVAWSRQPGLRLVWLLLVDVTLGLVLMLALWSTADEIALWMVSKSELTAVLLQDMLQWLMGVPAGLKLNNQLSNFLGRFFLYHIHLWGIYVRLVAPVLVPLLRLVAMSGLLGSTMVLAMLSDLLSAFLFHTYCLYIYAGRVFCVQTHMLASLVRLFAGRKWNVLRRRVDSLQSTSEQYLLGTLLFTVVLWLLPTTTVFYIVFSGVRLSVLVVYSLLAWLVLLLDHCPLCQLLLRLCGMDALEELDLRLVDTADCRPSSFITLRLNVQKPGDGALKKHLSMCNDTEENGNYVHSTMHADDDDAMGVSHAYLFAYGRPGAFSALFTGCPYSQCSVSALLPNLHILTLLQFLVRGYIIYAPTHRLCKADIDHG